MSPKESRAIMERLRRDSERIAARFELRYRCVEAERRGVRSRYGVCFSDGTIRIRLRHATSGRPLKYSSLVATLCHELAHLRHFNHGVRFRAFNQRLLDWARSEGIYQPGLRAVAPAPRVAARTRPPVPDAQERRDAGPLQLDLF